MRIPAPSIPLLVLAMMAAGLLSARADEAADCDGFAPLKDAGPISLGRIVDAEPRQFFIRNGIDAKDCPNETAACRDKAFLVPGDTVLLSRHRGAFVCADFIGRKGRDRAGWLPASAVTTQALPPVSLADWAGHWHQIESDITIKAAPGKPDALAIKGDATWGALDPDRVKRGAVNIGNIEGSAAPEGDAVRFAMGDDGKTLPIDKGDEFTCKVWMRRLGPYLLVDDNNNCGGMNVSFRGAYTRVP